MGFVCAQWVFGDVADPPDRLAQLFGKGHATPAALRKRPHHGGDPHHEVDLPRHQAQLCGDDHAAPAALRCAVQETPIVEVTRQITKHNFLVMNVDDIPRVMKEAFYLARTGRPGEG